MDKEPSTKQTKEHVQDMRRKAQKSASLIEALMTHSFGKDISHIPEDDISPTEH